MSHESEIAALQEVIRLKEVERVELRENIRRLNVKLSEVLKIAEEKTLIHRQGLRFFFRRSRKIPHVFVAPLPAPSDKPFYEVSFDLSPAAEIISITNLEAAGDVIIEQARRILLANLDELLEAWNEWTAR